MTTITIAIPFYYKSKFENLKNCLISINNQLVKPNEIIIVVNGFNKEFINKKKFHNFVMTFVDNIQTNIFSEGSFDSISFKRMHKKIKMRLDLQN